METENDNGSALSVLAELRLSINSLRDSIDKQRRMDAYRHDAPKTLNIQGTDVIAGGFGVVRLGAPAQGTFWYVRKLIVGGLTPTTTVAGRADVFVTAMDMDQVAAFSQTSMFAWKDQATSLPLIAPYGRGELPVLWPNALWVVFSNATNGQTYVAAGDVEQYQDSAMLENRLP